MTGATTAVGFEPQSKLGDAIGEMKSHRLGNKRVADSLLPRAADTPGGKPRGARSRAEQFQQHVRQGSNIIADSWRATTPAAASAGSRVVGTLNQSQ